jgi:alanine dehydrogenase
MQENTELRKGANVIRGGITFEGVADAFGLKLVPVDKYL